MTPNGPILLVENATAGGGRRAGLAAAVAQHLRTAGVAVEHIYTPETADACARLAAAVEGRAYRAVAIAGGDGTLAPAAAALAGTALPFAAIPTGSANILARDLGLATDAAAIAAVLRSGAPARPLSLGFANGVAFLVVAGAGLDGAAALTGAELKARLGRAAYWAGIAAGAARLWPALSVEIDGGASRTVDWALAGNARLSPGSLLTYGGAGLRLALMRGGLVARPAQLAALAAGRLALAPGVEIVSFKRAIIAAATPLPAQADGAPLGVTPLVLEAAPRPVLILGGVVRPAAAV